MSPLQREPQATLPTTILMLGRVEYPTMNPYKRRKEGSNPGTSAYFGHQWDKEDEEATNK